jgi:hypothetical protein
VDIGLVGVLVVHDVAVFAPIRETFLISLSLCHFFSFSFFVSSGENWWTPMMAHLTSDWVAFGLLSILVA